MTIFILDKDPSKTAEMLDDNSFDQMIKDIAQVLCNVHHEQSDYINEPDYFDSDIPLSWTGNALKKYKNSEWSQWARECKANYEYLVKLGLACCYELEIHRQFRYKAIKKYSKIMRWTKENVPNLKYYFESESTKEFWKFDPSDGSIKDSHKTPFPLVMPKKFQLDEKNTLLNKGLYGVIAYRIYYQAKLKQKFATKHPCDESNIFWTRRSQPDWINL